MIATFWGGKYPSKTTGNHAAFHLSHDAKGIFAVEQDRTTSPSALRKKRGGGTGRILWRNVKLPEEQTGEAPSMTNAGEYYYIVRDTRPAN